MILQQNRLRWYGHVLRKDDDDWVKKCKEYEVEGLRPRGRPKRTWKEVVSRVSAGECFFWYRPTRVVPDKRPLNGCCCCCCYRSVLCCHKTRPITELTHQRCQMVMKVYLSTASIPYVIDYPLQRHIIAGLSGRVVSASDCGVRGSRFKSRR